VTHFPCFFCSSNFPFPRKSADNELYKAVAAFFIVEIDPEQRGAQLRAGTSSAARL
jgi:hypothetical protein